MTSQISYTESVKAEILGEIKEQGKRIRDFDRRVSDEHVFDSVSDLIAPGPDYGFQRLRATRSPLSGCRQLGCFVVALRLPV